MLISECDDLCPSCNELGICLKGIAANDNDGEGIIRLPKPAKLMTKASVHRLAIAYRLLMPSSRRKLPDIICDIVWNYEGVVVDGYGFSIRHRDLDPDAILCADRDPSCAWIGMFYHFMVRAPLRAPRSQLQARLELLWLALAIKYPNVAQHITR